MRTIAVTGGKGGVGKSTIAILLALRLTKEGKRVVLMDADVECPNDYLLLNTSLGKKIETIKAFLPKINQEKCIKCGQCVKACLSNALFQPKGKPPIVLPELCSHCGACQLACPTGAIENNEQTIGFIYEQNIKDDLVLLTGQTKGIVEETGPLVGKLKKAASKKTKKIKADFLIIDTAAGLHCPVIQALLGVDSALLVTESTPLGLHDLKLSFELTQELKIPVKVVLNQVDLGKPELIDSFLEEKKIKTALRMPYSKDLVDHYANGKLIDFEGRNLKWSL